MVAEEGISLGPRTLIDLDGLDSHLSSFLASKDRSAQTPASPARAFDIYYSDHTSASTSRGTPRTESEIVVRVDDMDYEVDSPASDLVTQSDHE